MPGYRYGYKIRKYTSWFDGEIQGTMEEKEEAATITKEYLFKLLDYSDNEELLKEEVEKQKRLYQFAKKGPRAFYHRFNMKGKLTSAEVIHILASSFDSYRLAKIYDITPSLVRQLRRGEKREWEWEYDLVRRLKAIISTDLRTKSTINRSIYILNKVNKEGIKEPIVYTPTLRRAKNYRLQMLKKAELEKMEEEGTLDILYPITHEKYS